MAQPARQQRRGGLEHKEPEPPRKPTKREIDDAYAEMRRERPEPRYASIYDHEEEGEA